MGGGANGLTWTFKLRSGAVWTDGQPITAKDAAFTINTVVKFQGGAAAVPSPFVPGIKSATAVDDTTLDVTLAQPSAALIANLFQLPILPEHVWSEYAKGDSAKLKTVSMDPADGPVVSPARSRSRSSISRARPSSSASTPSTGRSP